MASWDCGTLPARTQEPCGCLPPGFSRLRYFFGKHLSAVDFEDEQRYHVGKQRFHNQRLHGTGVLCGLGLRRLDPDGAGLRVVRGAALDRCGREVVVGADQCIDVNAWYRRERERLNPDGAADGWPAHHLDPTGRLGLCVVIGYAECRAHPEPAPRDPCSCAEGGCEYGRVDEGFELTLLPEDEAHRLAQRDGFPTEHQIAAALAAPLGTENLLRRLALPITAGCPPPSEQAWILLGCLSAVLSNDLDSVTGLEAVGERGVPPVLLSTEVIQSLLARLYVGLDIDIGAPSVTTVLFEEVANPQDSSKPNYRFVLKLSGEVEGESIDSRDSFQLRRLGSTGWDAPGSVTVESEYQVDSTYGHVITVSVDNASEYLVDGGIYHLYADPGSDPIVDEYARMLQPRNFVWRFQLLKNPQSGFLEMSIPPVGATI